MFELLGRVCGRLGTLPHALIGAGAMSVVGFARATQDLDLLVLHQGVLDRDFWSGFEDCEVDIGDGRCDPSDPLLGVVRIVDSAGNQVDVVVGRHPRWQRPILTRATAVELGGVSVPVAESADLVLLKLHAGSINDQRDISELVRLDPTIKGAVDARGTTLPRSARELWSRIRDHLYD
jgi:predicted nucleotidyltransferase